MGRTILCPHCKSTFDEDILAKRSEPNICPVCEENLCGASGSSGTAKEKTKWYYYDDNGVGTLTTTLSTTLSNSSAPLYSFDAVDLEDAERQLKEVMPNSPLFKNNTPDKVKCPYCHSSEIQIIPRKFSLLTGFATNKFDRVCLRCKNRF